MSAPAAELEATWLHDRLTVVLPVDRDRLLPVLALASCIAILMISLSAGLAAGVALGMLPLVFRDRRRAALTIDRRTVTVERSARGPLRAIRIPLGKLEVSTGEDPDRLCLTGAGTCVTVRWGGSPEALRWIVDRILEAKAMASPDDDVDLPPPPPELSQLRRVASRWPRAREDHFRV